MRRCGVHPGNRWLIPKQGKVESVCNSRGDMVTPGSYVVQGLTSNGEEVMHLKEDHKKCRAVEVAIDEDIQENRDEKLVSREEVAVDSVKPVMGDLYDKEDEPLTVAGQTALSLPVAGKTGSRFSYYCSFFQNSLVTFIIHSSSRCNSVVSAVYHLVGLASWVVFHRSFCSMSHPNVVFNVAALYLVLDFNMN
ncbi:unnamed protein product [Cuscuta epithymum]|uniref:Uncharacterized protein n=1 Tax=Cuscuta epithymum TaxID=186058 RepID=A0AAV0F5D0_9ASTE|nr:unnamed protein product [Cuscuta epithymum]